MTALETFRLVVSLAAAQDGDIFEQVAARHPQDIPASHLDAFRGIARELQRLINEYDYIDSPAFVSSIQGKSTEVSEMMRKLASSPVRRTEYRHKFIEALGHLPERPDAFALVSERHHAVLAKALQAFALADNGASG